jgi:hypothetical protein
MLKKLFCKKPSCVHEYSLLTKYKANDYEGTDFYILYCPKCKKEITVLKYVYEKIIAKQIADKEYDDGRAK